MRRLGAILILLVAAVASIGAKGCASLQLPPVTPATPPPAVVHVPGCAATGTARECWDQRPGEGWAFVCADGLTRVVGPAACPAAPPIVPTPEPGPEPQPDTCHTWDGPGPEPGLFEADVNAGIDAACAAQGVTCGLDGPPRPGDWKVFVANTADAVVARGFVVTYDYRSGEGGRASEMSVKRGDRVENYQIESSAGRVRRPHGAYRSFCSPPSGEGQPIQRPTPPAGDPATCSADTPDATTFVLDVRWNQDHTRAWVDATPKMNNRDWCGAHYCADCAWPNQNALVICPTRPEGHPARKDCDLKHGRPVWFVDDASTPSDEGDPFHVHVPAGSRVKACLDSNPSACSSEITVQ